MGVTNDEGVRATGIICFFCTYTIQKDIAEQEVLELERI